MVPCFTALDQKLGNHYSAMKIKLMNLKREYGGSMFHPLILALGVNMFACDNPFAKGDTLFPQDSTAAHILATLPRTDSSAGTVGILFTTKVFAQTSPEPRNDADSALSYLTQAQRVCPGSAVYQAYWCAARMLRVQHRKQNETLFILDTVQTVFNRADSLVRGHPENRVVQFLVGCMFQNAHWLMNNAAYYWERSREILTKLDGEATSPASLRSFYTPEIRANIRLNLAHLCTKDGTDEGKIARKKILQTILSDFPNTLAAKRARTFLVN